MRYLVNHKTKEHVIYVPWLMNSQWTLVEADSEGWIAHTCNECPLPDDCLVDVRMKGLVNAYEDYAVNFCWNSDKTGAPITHYHPILEPEKVQEPEPALPADCIETPDLFNRLDAAHHAAAQIPDIIAQIKAKLEQYGHTVVPMSPFVAAAIAEPEPAVETPQEDMTDWRNWRDNDLIMLKDGIKSGNAIIAGEKYQITHKTKDGFWIDTKMRGSIHIRGRVGDFRFHCRPAKGEK